MQHATTTARPADASPGRRGFARATSLAGTIRGQILIAFVIMSVITAALGGYAALDIQRAGVLVAKTFDESLMSINYARAAATDFAAMQGAFARRWTTTDRAIRHALDDEVDSLNKSLVEDLDIASERAQSVRATQAAARVVRAVGAWNEVRASLTPDTDADTAWRKLDHYASIVDQQVDLLVNYTAGDGFTYRQSARAAVATDMQINIAATVLALLVSTLVAWLLARRIIGPVAAASEAATRIARGELDGAIPHGGADELGAMLGAMRIMRNNIRTMMEREVAQRRSAQARLADALEGSREGIVVVDAEGRIALANSQAVDYLGGAREALQPGTPVDQLTDIAGPAQIMLRSSTLPATSEARLADGRWLRVSQSATQEGGFIAVSSDITQLKNQEAELQATNLRLDAALDNMSQGLCLFDAGNRLEVVNRRFCEIFRLPPERVLPGITRREIIEMSVAAGNHGDQTAEALMEAQLERIEQRVAATGFEELSEDRVVAVAHQPLVEGGWLVTYEDVTERRHSEDQIVFMARHDALTSLPNRVLLGERIEQALAQMGREGEFAVLCLDLDRFKQINETLGHSVGDELLRRVADRLLACAREVDTVARLGGDEFAIVQCGIERPQDATILARRIVEVVSAPYDIDGHLVTVGVSIGIALAPGDATQVDKLMKHADVALYRAKLDGRGTWRFFEADMDARLQARRTLELDLGEALAKDQFELRYQPLYDLDLERICGFEALLRWRHPQRGLVSPAEFIPLVEEIGMIVPLGEWVLRRACAEATLWPQDIKIAVNVSAVQFKTAHLVDVVKDALRSSGLSARRLELEITESVLLTDSEATVATLHALRNIGVRISMDDFGTGYSSLSYLRSFPFDKIKIDQSFIRDLSTEGGSDVIVRAITSLGRNLDMRTTAEGVETKQQFAWLQREGCDELQGYLISPPAPADEIPGLIERYNHFAPALS